MRDKVVEHTVKLLAGMGKLPTDSMEALPKIMVGLEGKVEALMKKLKGDEGRSSMVLLHGMGGIGKTTLAKAVFNELHGSDPALPCCFVQLEPGLGEADISERQRHLLKDLAHVTNPMVHTTAAGRKELARALQGKRVLMVVDNVWGVQLELLLSRSMLQDLCLGSMVLVTSRESGAAKGFDAVKKAEADFLSELDAMQLLCQHAYGSSMPPAAEEQQVKGVLARCGGLPMALEVVGSHLRQCSSRQRFFNDLSNALADAYKHDPAERMDGARTLFAALRLSWKALDAEQQEALLDITWLLKGQPWEVVEACCGYGVLDRLCRFGLVKQQGSTHIRGELVVAAHDTIVAFCQDSGEGGIGRNPRRITASGGGRALTLQVWGCSCCYACSVDILVGMCLVCRRWGSLPSHLRGHYCEDIGLDYLWVLTAHLVRADCGPPTAGAGGGWPGGGHGCPDDRAAGAEAAAD
jgi:DNA polymerase III delta prime subunit